MLVKLGVDIRRLQRPARRALNIVDRTFARFNQEAVITSTYEGNHSPSSLHYADLAFDLRLPPTQRGDIIAQLKNHLANHFDIVQESTHIHIEYDPKHG